MSEIVHPPPSQSKAGQDTLASTRGRRPSDLDSIDLEFQAEFQTFRSTAMVGRSNNRGDSMV